MLDSTLPTRGSWRTRGAAALSSVTLRQISAVLPHDKAWAIWASRQIVAHIMDTFGPPLAGIQVDPIDTRLTDGRRLVGEWIRGPHTADATGAIYYIHGSGFALCSPRTHRRLTAWLSRTTGLPVFSVDYRLAPEYQFPAAADDVRTGWDWLCNSGEYPPERIVIAGDSAGGHLGVDLLLQPGVAHPAGLTLLSPLVDLTFTLARARESLHADAAISASDAQRLVGLYCAGADISNPRLTLDVSGGRRLPRTLIQAGGAEMLQDDARQLAADITAADGQCELQIWPDQVHVFQALPRLNPEAVPAIRLIADFMLESLRRTETETTGGSTTQR